MIWKRRPKKEKTPYYPEDYIQQGQAKPHKSVDPPVRPPGSKPPRHPGGRTGVESASSTILRNLVSAGVVRLDEKYDLRPDGFIVKHTDDERLKAWERIADHPIFRKCYDTDGTLIDAMVERLNELAKKEKKYDQDHSTGSEVQDRFLLGRFLRGN